MPPIQTIEFTKSIPFPGRRLNVGERLTGHIVKTFTTPDGVDRFIFLEPTGNGMAKAWQGISFRSVSILEMPNATPVQPDEEKPWEHEG